MKYPVMLGLHKSISLHVIFTEMIDVIIGNIVYCSTLIVPQ